MSSSLDSTPEFSTEFVGGVQGQSPGDLDAATFTDIPETPDAPDQADIDHATFTLDAECQDRVVLPEQINPSTARDGTTTRNLGHRVVVQEADAIELTNGEATSDDAALLDSDDRDTDIRVGDSATLSVRERPQPGDIIQELASQPRNVATYKPLPVFDLGIDSHNPNAGSHSEPWGRVEEHQMTASDGSKYNVNVFRPDRSQSDAVPVTYTTPWFTDLAGFNNHVGTMLAREGLSVIAVSPEQRDLTKAIFRLGDASMAHDAEVHHLILDQLADADGTDLEHMVNFGYSRGAMVGFGLQAYAGQHDRTFTYSDYIDPCFAHEAKIGEIPWDRLYPNLTQELGALAIASIPTSSRNVLDVMSTLMRPPGFWVSQISTGLALFRGEAGDFVPHMPEDSHMHVTLFRDSIFNHAEDWKSRLSRFPNVKISEEDGGHLTGSDTRVIDKAIRRIKTAQEV